MNQHLQSVYNGLNELARICGATALLINAKGEILRVAAQEGSTAEPHMYTWIVGTSAYNSETGQLSFGMAPDGRKFWMLRLDGAGRLVLLESFPSERNASLKKIFLAALPYIAKVTGGEAVLFDGSGRRIASRDAEGHEDKDKLIHSPLAQQAMSTMKPVFGPSVMDDASVAVRIPIVPDLGIGFSNFFAVKYKKIHSGSRGNAPGLRIDDITGSSARLQACKKQAHKIAASSSTTVVCGETGTGKELFVHAIHNESPRSAGPFVAVNCGGIPENLIETLFFGYEGGTFTGAKREGHVGIFEQANGGSLFLDEIGEMALSLQAHFLRVLQDNEIVRVGGRNQIPVDVRIFAATNRNLPQLVEQGLFRQDLYYRLNVLELHLPPLRERPEDIAELAHFFVIQLRASIKTNCQDISREAIACLQRYSWPGNVRELRNVIERAMNMADGRLIMPCDLPDFIAGPPPMSPRVSPLRSSARFSERDTIAAALATTHGNRRQAAERLGISTTTLWRRMRELGLGDTNNPC